MPAGQYPQGHILQRNPSTQLCLITSVDPSLAIAQHHSLHDSMPCTAPTLYTAEARVHAGMAQQYYMHLTLLACLSCHGLLSATTLS